MSNTNNVRGKITNWLLEEGLAHTLTPNENFDFVIRVTNVFGAFYVDISKEKGRERIYFSINLGYQDEPTQKAFSKLTPKEKEDLHYNLRLGIMNYGVEYNFQPPNFQELHTVILQNPVFLEDMTKTNFMNGFYSIRNAIAFLTLSIGRYVSNETSPSQSKIQPPGMG